MRATDEGLDIDRDPYTCPRCGEEAHTHTLQDWIAHHGIDVQGRPL